VTLHQQLLYDTVKRNFYVFGMLQGHTGGPFMFWVGAHRYVVSIEDVRYVLARLVLEGVKVNASLDA
jgi:hypothetical protein